METQREEIRKLHETLERHKNYIKELESLFEDAINHMDLDEYHHYKSEYDALMHTA